LAALSACAGSNNLRADSLRTSIRPGNASSAGSRTVAGSVMSKDTPPDGVHAVADTASASTGGKLIALTFDDGPRPYVLFGSRESNRGPGLVDILDQNGVKATFFVVGWRLTPKTWGEPKHEEDIGVTCIDAAERLIRRGHELED